MGTSEKNDTKQKIKYNLILRPQSYSDIEQTFLWYEEQERNLGIDFIEQIEDSFKRIRSNPQSYQIIKKNLRRALVKKFPYAIFYKILDKEILVIAIFHLSRNPKRIVEIISKR